MQSSSEQMAKQSNDAQNQAAAQALAEAAAIAQRQGLGESMQQASQQTSQNQLSSAGQQQASAQQTLQQMLQQMGQQDRFKQEILRRRLLQLAEALERLVQRQGGEVDRTKATVGEVAALEPGQSTLRRNTMDVAEQAREGEASKPVAQRMDEAIDGQGQAITSLRQNQRDPALEHQQSALVHLQEALNLVRNMQKQAQEEQQRQKRQDLRELYEKLAKAQEELRHKTQAMKDRGELNRRQRAALVELGDQQSDLRGEARQLQDQVAESTILFRHMHERIDRAAQGVVGELRAARATAPVVADQAMIASLLRHLAEALAQANEQSEFAQAGGEGGQGGGGSGEPPLVPPIAELRLLRGLQQTVYQRTREVAQQDAASAAGEVSQLSLRQRELAALGEELIEAMQRQQQMMAPPAP
jgi:myosin heavy subunit